MSSELCLETGLTIEQDLCTMLSVTRFTDAISDKSRRKWIEEGHHVRPGGPDRPGPEDTCGPDVEYDPFIDLEDIDEIAALMSQPPGNGREDDE